MTRPATPGHAMLIACLLVAIPAHAQTAREGGGANAQMQQQLQQLASERTALQAENARLKTELQGLRRDVDGLRQREQSLDARSRSAGAAAEQSARGRETAEHELAQLRQRSDELVARFRETAQTLRETETDRASLRETLATRDRELSVCAERNVALYDINVEALERLEGEGFWSRVGRAEPFTQLKRVEMENLVADYRNRAGDQRVTTAPTSPPASPPEP